MKIGYARVSTKDQHLDMQMDALKQAGCEQIFSEHVTGATRERPELKRLLEQLRPDDVVVIWKLDRLGRSLADLVSLVNDIQQKGAGLLSINDHIDTTTPQGKLTFHIFAAIAQFEREIIGERTRSGLAAARARGRKGGRPKGLSKNAQDKAMIAETLYKQGNLSVQDICSHLAISKMTLYRYLRFRNVSIGVKATVS
jgi:DNA invertase Pin-like site-specific DNA recombinase